MNTGQIRAFAVTVKAASGQVQAKSMGTPRYARQRVGMDVIAFRVGPNAGLRRFLLRPSQAMHGREPRGLSTLSEGIQRGLSRHLLLGLGGVAGGEPRAASGESPVVRPSAQITQTAKVGSCPRNLLGYLKNSCRFAVGCAMFDGIVLGFLPCPQWAPSTHAGEHVVRITSILLTLSLTILPLAGCGREEPVSKSTPPTTRGDAPPSPNIGNTTATGKVTETMNTAGYTYVCVDTGSDKVWAAAPQVEVKVGDEVTIPQGTPMQNYHSKTLDRDFEVIYFVSGFLGPDGQSLSKEGL